MNDTSHFYRKRLPHFRVSLGVTATLRGEGGHGGPPHYKGH
jgi:hypothetical protein